MSNFKYSFFAFFLPLFYGWIVLWVILYKIIRHGKRFFETKITEAPKFLFSPKYGTHQFATLKKQGIRLHYVENGNRNNPMILLMHGFPDFWFSWRNQIPVLAQNYWVVSVDMRGYSESDHPQKISAYKTEHLVEDMKELITTLGKDSAIVIAHDWGGAIAWHLELKYPELVNKLIILNAPHPHVFKEVLSTSWKQFLMSWYVFFFQLPYLPEFYLRSCNLNGMKKIYQKNGKQACSDEEFEAYRHVFSQPGAFTAPINYYRASIKTVKKMMDNTNREEKRTSSPTLVIWGDKDIALSTELAKKTPKYCDSVRLEIIEGAGHWVHHEKPDLVNKHIETFLKA